VENNFDNNFDYIVRNNYPEADFWLINKGSEKRLGEPTKEFQPYLTGIKCPALILPDYGFYVAMYLHQQEFWCQYAIGCTNLKSLKLSRIIQTFAELSEQYRTSHLELTRK